MRPADKLLFFCPLILMLLSVSITTAQAMTHLRGDSAPEAMLSLALLPGDRDLPDKIAIHWSGEPTDRYWVGHRRADGTVSRLITSVAMDEGIQLASLPPALKAEEAVVVVESADGIVLAHRRLIAGEGDGYGWQPQFYGPGLLGSVLSAVVWNDGNGSALYVGGNFRMAGRHVVNGVARWDGSAWSPLTGPNGTGVSLSQSHVPGSVNSMVVHDNTLVVAGLFIQAGGETANGIARWDGQAWSTFAGSWGIGLTNIATMAVYRGDLIVGGGFFSASGESARKIARWDSGDGVWRPLGQGVQDPQGICGSAPYPYDGVHDLIVHDDTLFVGGCFQRAGGVPIEGIARWDGSTWSGVSSNQSFSGSTPRYVSELAFFDGDLVAGGRFTGVNGITMNNITRFDGSAWHALGAGTSGPVHALRNTGSSLLVGGYFSQAGSTTVNNIASWSGSAWSALIGSEGAGLSNQGLGGVYAMTSFQGRNYIGGVFQHASGMGVNNLATWNGVGWSQVNEPGAAGGLSMGLQPGTVHAALSYHGDLIVAGTFRFAGSREVNGIARWNGVSWSGFGTGMFSIGGAQGTVLALAEHEGELIAAGSFILADGASVQNIARWNGSTWMPLGGGLEGTVRVLAVRNGELIAGGIFTTAGGTTLNRIARWNGSHWLPLEGPSGNGVNGPIHALAVAQDDLVVGGQFSDAAGVTVGNVATWDGTEWHPMGSSTATVTDLGIHQGTIYGTMRRLARWSNPIWQDIPGLADPPGAVPRPVSTIASHQGALFAAGGDFDHENLPGFLNGFGRWNGHDWSPLGIGQARRHNGEFARVEKLASHGDQIVVGSDMSSVAGIAAWGLASWRAEPVMASVEPRLPSLVNTPVSVSVVVTGEETLPIPGRVRVRADSGQECVAEVADVVAATAARYSCSMLFTSAGTRQLSARFSRSPDHRTLELPIASHTVYEPGEEGDELQLDVQRLQAVTSGTFGTESMRGYRIHISNTSLHMLSDVRLRVDTGGGLLNVLWLCEQVDSGCAPSAGTGFVDTAFNLAAGNSALVDVTGHVDSVGAWIHLPIAAEAQWQGLNTRADLTIIDAVDDDGIHRSGFSREIRLH